MRSLTAAYPLVLSLVVAGASSARADELTEGAVASYDRESLRPTGLDLGFATFSKSGGSNEFQHLGPYLRFSYRWRFIFAYTSLGVSRASLAFRRRSLKLERVELGTTAFSIGQGIGVDTEFGHRTRLAFFLEGERTVWTSVAAVDEVRTTSPAYQAVGDELRDGIRPTYRWSLVRMGSLFSVQLGRVAPYVSVGYVWFTARLSVALPHELEEAVTKLGLDPEDVAGDTVSRETPAGSFGAIVTITRAWALTAGAGFMPLDDDFDDWVVAANLALGRRF